MALYPKLSVNGVWNEKTREYFQRYLKMGYKGKSWYTGYVDGQWGKMSIQGLQRCLKHHGLYNGLIDGVHGAMTNTAYNKFLRDKFPFRPDLGPIDTYIYFSFTHSKLVSALQNGLNILARYDTTKIPKVIHT